MQRHPQRRFIAEIANAKKAEQHDSVAAGEFWTLG
jgi:hypothetical protein